MQETVAPHKRIKSDGVIFVLALLAAVILAYVSGFLAFLLPRFGLIIRFAVYVLLTAGVYWIIRRRMTGYRYVAGDNAFAVYRVVGRKEKPEPTERVRWEDALFLRPYGEIAGGEKGREFLLSAKKKKDSMVLAHRQGGRLNHLIISPGEAMTAAIAARIGRRGEGGSHEEP